jgi:hypothetical protein
MPGSGGAPGSSVGGVALPLSGRAPSLEPPLWPGATSNGLNEPASGISSAPGARFFGLVW